VSEFSEFNAVSAPLEPGFTVIEASAGTGKTTAITTIVLRLVAEIGLPIEQILVTTYTELATAELRDRMRKILQRALDASQSGSAADDLISEIVRRAKDPAQLRRRLENALRNFDEAPIFTIHGFCARALAEKAFETGTFFDAEFSADQSQILAEVADDFWRRNIFTSGRITAAIAREKIQAKALINLLNELTNNPRIRVLPPSTEAGLKGIEQQIVKKWNQLCADWNASRREIVALFQDTGWAKGNHAKREIVEAQFAVATECFGRMRSGAQLLACLDFFSAETIKASTRTRTRIPTHQFFHACQSFAQLANSYAAALQSYFCTWAREELHRRKADRRTQSFDDLLTQLEEALRGKRGEPLRKSLRQRFAAALIDEFQDTDPIQYSIFSQIYDGSASPVFLIGDPKQAIYGFRGADVFTYIAAASRAHRRYTLPKNWRSERELVEAVNSLFQRRNDAFVIDGISPPAVTSSGKADETPLTRNDERDQPFHFWIMAKGGRIPEAVAAEIARLLNTNTKIGDRTIEPADIAILVTTNWQPEEIQNALGRLRIPSVVYSAANVFKSREAVELMRILTAVAEPTREKFVRTALVTEAIGMTAEELETACVDDVWWEQRLNRFAEYHLAWRDRGFVTMIRELLVRESARARLLRLVDGERRLTNLLHLIELLHSACTQNGLGIDSLIAWLARQMSDSGEGKEEYELRLESDEDAVRIVTVHKSKGLQYGITFCPYSWRTVRSREFTKFHDSGELALDLAANPEHKEAQAREELAESVRQLYVAVTRAEHRCYLLWNETSRAAKSATAWLMSQTSADAFIEHGVTAEMISARIRSELGDTVAVETLPDLAGTRYDRRDLARRKLQPRLFNGMIDRNWGISSFSSLVSGQMREPESPDYDSAETVIEPDSEPVTAAEGIHAFPGGTHAGTCLHRILEKLDFAAPDLIRPTVDETLSTFGIEGFAGVVSNTIETTLAIPLGTPAFRLSEIQKSSRLSELEFTFPINGLTATRLHQLLIQNFGSDFPETIGRLQFQPSSGFMKGFVDLVVEHAGKFYIFDWKSNWLGPSTASYAQQNLAAEMVRNFYVLQLSIYTVALHRYLVQRVPRYDYEKDFGGVFYIFLRGVDAADPASGVFPTRPALGFVEGMNSILNGDN